MAQDIGDYGNGRRNSQLIYTAFRERRDSVDSLDGNGTKDPMDPEILDRLEEILHQINAPLYKDRSRLEAQASSLQKQLSDSEHSNQTLREQAEALQSMNDELSRDMESLQNASSTSLMNHSRQEVEIQHLQEQVELLTSQLEQANEYAETARVDMEALQRMHSAIQDERIAAQEERNEETVALPKDEPNHQNTMLIKSLEQKDKEIARLTEAKAELRTALTAAQQRIDEATVVNQQITAEFERLHTSNRHLKEQYDQVVEEKQHAEDLVVETENKLEHCESIMEQLRVQVEDLTHEIEESHDQNSLLLDELDHIQSQHEDLTAHQMEEKFVNMMDELKPLKEEKMRGMQIDADHEFFALTFLSAKVNMSQKLKCPQISDVRMEDMYTKSQSESVPMHNFHYWIEQQLTEHANKFKDVVMRPSRKWSTAGPRSRGKRQSAAKRRTS